MIGQLRIADVFCGMGSFNVAAEELNMRCVYACDGDSNVQKSYVSQFGIAPDGDLKKTDLQKIPEHDILCISFPYQSTSRTPGTNPNDVMIARAIEILRVKRPKAYVMEHGRGLLTSNNGEDFRTLETMIKTTGYSVSTQLLKCEDFGIPQTRHRIFIVGFPNSNSQALSFKFPSGANVSPKQTLSEFLDMDIAKPLSNTIRSSGRKVGIDNPKNWSAYRLKDGTEFEYELEHVIKLQGFPLDFEWGNIPEVQKWKIVGNTIPTCLTKALLGSIKNFLLSLSHTVSVMTQPKITESIGIKRKIEVVEPPTVNDKNTKPSKIAATTQTTDQLCIITIKSGTSLCLTLPPGTLHQEYLLRII
jgi:site-specific DNA-cytosine methylase